MIYAISTNKRHIWCSTKCVSLLCISFVHTSSEGKISHILKNNKTCSHDSYSYVDIHIKRSVYICICTSIILVVNQIKECKMARIASISTGTPMMKGMKNCHFGTSLHFGMCKKFNTSNIYVYKHLECHLSA